MVEHAREPCTTPVFFFANVAVISSFILIDFPHFFHSIPFPEVGRICVDAPPLELSTDEVEVVEPVEEVELATGTTGACDSSDTELFDAERAPRGETGGEGVEEEAELLSWEPVERPRVALGTGREDCCCCEAGGCLGCEVVSIAEMEITGGLVFVKAGVDLDITMEVELRLEGEELSRREVAEPAGTVVGIAKPADVEEVAEVVEGTMDEVSAGAELEFAKGDAWGGWGDRLAAYCSRVEYGLVSFCPMKDCDRGGDSDIVGEAPFVLRIAGADTLSPECGRPGGGGGAGMGGLVAEAVLVLMLTSELVNREYLKGG